MNSEIKKIVKDFFTNFFRKFFVKFYWRQHPETALRYIPVVKEITKAKLENLKILEIGSGSLGIIPYLKRQIDAADIDFEGPKTELINRIKAKATDLPFRKNSYDVTISVDVLEHLPANSRETAVSEQIRVTKKMAIIVVPVGEKSENQDKKLNLIWAKKFPRKENQFLSEHVQNGLPKVEEILVLIDRSSRSLQKRVTVKSYPLLNLAVREILMRTWITRNKLLYYLYLKGYLLLLPILKYANFGNCYRRLFVIEFLGPDSSPLESKFTLSKIERDKIGKTKDKNMRGSS